MADSEMLTPDNVAAALSRLRPTTRETIIRGAAWRFLMSTQRGDTNECWPWVGRARPSGYGLFSVGRAQSLQATWVALMAATGTDPHGRFALHSCDNPRCVNPAHLRWGDAKANSDDREARGRSVKPRGERHGHAKLTEEQVRRIRNGGGSGADMAREMGISQTVVSLIRRGKIWRHVDG